RADWEGLSVGPHGPHVDIQGADPSQLPGRNPFVHPFYVIGLFLGVGEPPTLRPPGAIAVQGRDPQVERDERGVDVVERPHVERAGHVDRGRAFDEERAARWTARTRRATPAL